MKTSILILSVFATCLTTLPALAGMTKVSCKAQNASDPSKSATWSYDSTLSLFTFSEVKSDGTAGVSWTEKGCSGAGAGLPDLNAGPDLQIYCKSHDPSAVNASVYQVVIRDSGFEGLPAGKILGTVGWSNGATYTDGDCQIQ